MSTTTDEQAGPPDVRGATSSFPRGILATGAVALALVLGGTVFVQTLYAVRGGGVTPACEALGLIPFQPATNAGPQRGIEGAEGVCHIVEGITSSTQSGLLALGMVLGLAAVALGWGSYMRMDTRRKRDHAMTGAVVGLQAVVFGAFLWWFAHGSPEKFALQFLNFERLKGHDGYALVRGMKYTLMMAFGGELGGIVIGLILALLVISGRRSVRAPARAYINFFRGTPLLWQLSAFYFGLALGLGIHIGVFAAAVLIFALNTGAYAAEVFRAGIQSIERGQIEAARSLGMSYLQSMRYAIVPQAVRRVIPPLLNEYVILVKDTSLVVILGLPLQQLDLFSAGQQGYSDTFSATYFVGMAVG